MMFRLFNRSSSGYTALADSDTATASQSLPSAAGMVAPPTRGGERGAGTHPDFESPVEVCLKATEAARALRSWKPMKGPLKTLLDQATEIEAFALKGCAGSAEDRRKADALRIAIAPPMNVWKAITDLKLNRLDHHAWTLADPLEAPFDELVQRQLAMADHYFQIALYAFKGGDWSEAFHHLEYARSYSELADGVLECRRLGTEEHAALLKHLFDMGRSLNKFDTFKGLLRDAPWRGHAARSGGGSGGGSGMVGPSGTAVPSSSGSPMQVPSGVPQSPVATAKDVDATDLQHRLRELSSRLRPSFADLEHRRETGAPVIPLEDPDRRMKSILDILQQNAPPRGKSATPNFLKLLGSLEEEVKRAESSAQLRKAATEAQEALTSVLDGHPDIQAALRLEENAVQDHLKRSMGAAAGDDLDRADKKARLGLELATSTLLKARKALAGDWPRLEAQSARRLALSRLCDENNQRPLVMGSRLVERFRVQLRQFESAEDQDQADAALDRMEVTAEQVGRFNTPPSSGNGGVTPYIPIIAVRRAPTVSVATQTDVSPMA